ncbi:MAG: YcxB family protein [Caldilineales bacterium]
MTIEYDLTIEDMVALTQFHSDHSPRETRRRRVVQGLIVVVFLLLLFSAVDSIRQQGAGLSPGWVAASSVPLICPTILLVLVFSTGVRHWSTNRSVHKAFPDRAGRNGCPCSRLTVSAREDPRSVRRGEMALEWSEVADVTRTDDRVFVFGTSEQALVVPRRAFADQVAYDAFCDELQSYRTSVS